MSHAYFENPALLSIPFDQYERYQMIREAVLAAAPLIAPNRPLKVLDVGGYAQLRRGGEILLARAFLPMHEVYVLDQPACQLEGYIQGDGRRLQFADQSFDLVISCDAYEHVPAADRQDFWQELLRVTRAGVLLTAPFAHPQVVACEQFLFDYIYRETNGFEQRQLREHAAYGLPDLTATQAMLDTLGVESRAYPGGQVELWLGMMLVKHYLLLSVHSFDLEEYLDAYYIQRLVATERREPAYRHLVLAAPAASAAWLPIADAVLTQAMHTPTPTAPDEIVGWRAMQQHYTWLHQQHTAQAAYIATLEQTLQQKNQHIAQLEQLVQRIANGRVMRLLNLLNGINSRTHTPRG